MAIVPNPIEQMKTFFKVSSFPTNRAELLLLSRYTLPNEPSNVPDSLGWKAVLGDDPANILTRFLAEGLVHKAEPVLTLQHRWSSELKALAKERGLPSSGTKEMLAKRLVNADPEGMANLVADKNFLVCTTKGRILVEKFQEAERHAKERAESECLEALKQRRFKAACSVIGAYEASRVFPRGVGIDWQRYDCSHDLSVLQIIFTAHLSRHARFGEDTMLNLRLAAAMIHLWGTNDPSPWLPDNSGDDKTVLVTEARMLLFHALNRVRLQEMKEAGIRRVKILSPRNSDDCPTCRSNDGKTYPIDGVPILPHEGCTCECGCRCITIAIE